MEKEQASSDRVVESTYGACRTLDVVDGGYVVKLEPHTRPERYTWVEVLQGTKIDTIVDLTTASLTLGSDAHCLGVYAHNRTVSHTRFTSAGTR